MPTGALADEILLEGEGKIRALLCLGGNPMMAWPDQINTREALEGLDLLVVLDPKLTQTGQLADYIIPPKLVPEIPVMTFDFEELESFVPNWGYSLPYGAYCKALGIESGMLMAITSRRTTIHAVAKASEELRRGVISMSHSYEIDLESLDPSSDPGAPAPYFMGGHTGALASADLDYEEPYTGIPRMSAIPVHVTVGPHRG